MGEKMIQESSLNNRELRLLINEIKKNENASDSINILKKFISDQKGSGDKYKMFKNFMYNELEISKLDIKNWIRESVKDTANRMVKNEFDDFNVKDIVKSIIFKEEFFGSKQLKDDVIAEIGKQIFDKIEFKDK